MDNYVSCSNIVSGWSEKIHNNLVRPEGKTFAFVGIDSVERSFFKKHIVARLGYIGLTPLRIIACAIDTIIGLGAASVSFVTLGKKEVVRFADRHLRSSQEIISLTYLSILHILKSDVLSPNSKCNVPILGIKIGMKGNGLLTNSLYSNLLSLTREYRDKGSNAAIRQILPRLMSAILAIGCIFTRSIDLVIGLVALPFSLLIAATNIKCLNEKAMWIHNIAFRGLQVTGIISDLFWSVSRIFNTRAGN